MDVNDGRKLYASGTCRRDTRQTPISLAADLSERESSPTVTGGRVTTTTQSSINARA